ncbi:MAG: S8 family peptidase [Vulcanimicrobiota bacterium]
MNNVLPLYLSPLNINTSFSGTHIPEGENKGFHEEKDTFALKSLFQFNDADFTPQGTINVIVSAQTPEKLDEIKFEALQNPRNHVKAELPLINAVALELSPDSPALINDIGNSRGEVHINIDGTMTVIDPRDSVGPVTRMDTATRTMGIDKLWNMGYRGKGVTIAVIDTGIAPHPDFKDRIVAFRDFTKKDSSNAGRASESLLVDAPYDDQGHGTHCTGIAAGDGSESGGRLAGAAPEAQIVGAKVLNKNGIGSDSDIIAGIQWVVELKRQGKLNVDIISLSLGGSCKQSYKDDPLMQAVEKAVENGISVFAAAGNSGEYGPISIDTPGAAPNVVTVGALDDKGTLSHDDDERAEFSGIGPTLVDVLTKPDIMAPGVNITATSHKGGYISHSGTSMATPLAAGMAALLKQAGKEIEPNELKEIIKSTAEDLKGLPPEEQGAGVFNVVKAFEHETGQVVH